ncbi:oxidoreductase [Reticulibacter mediterranei]|uniref:Oxidoreductase n=1 Tax=Reticulibacter mediterranei TaxID=2778369 RepID=A0A8J3IJ29_9CHLR|nr:aldo/keto reductase [Reticulibacter mediterranei]GHO90576.1 oxidoreductase [Reticulibacter mediterranei]
MRYKLFGHSGLRVSELCLGTMTFGEEWGYGTSKETCRQIFETFLQAGGNFLDTANLYTNGTSERYLGEFVQDEREHLVLATKYTMSSPGHDPNAAGTQRKNLVQSLEASLKRLGTDYIDVYFIHMWDFLTPIEEVMRALDDMIRAGKVLYVGISNTPAWIISRANTLAELRGWTAFTGIQVEYNLIGRAAERELLPMARSLDLAVTVWSPLASGILTGKYNQGQGGGRAGLAVANERSLSIAAEVVKIAEARECSPSQVALSWVRQQPGVIIPILGARTVAQLKENLQCLQIRLTEEEMSQLDAASQIDLGYPHTYLQPTDPHNFAYGGMFDQIDAHRGIEAIPNL